MIGLSKRMSQFQVRAENKDILNFQNFVGCGEDLHGRANVNWSTGYVVFIRDKIKKRIHWRCKGMAHFIEHRRLNTYVYRHINSMFNQWRENSIYFSLPSPSSKILRQPSVFCASPPPPFVGRQKYFGKKLRDLSFVHLTSALNSIFYTSTWIVATNNNKKLAMKPKTPGKTK